VALYSILGIKLQDKITRTKPNSHGYSNGQLSNMDRPGRHFLPGTKFEYLDVLFAGSGYELSTICSHVKYNSYS